MWAKLSDDFAAHPKVHALGDQAPAALAVWITGLCYTAKYLLDGFVPEGVVAGVGLTPEQARTGAAQLVRVGLWEIAEGGYRVHDYTHCNPTREQAAALREKRRAAGSLGGQAKRDGARPRIVGMNGGDEGVIG